MPVRPRDVARGADWVWDTRAARMVWPAEWRVCAYSEPGLPSEAIKRGRIEGGCDR